MTNLGCRRPHRGLRRRKRRRLRLIPPDMAEAINASSGWKILAVMLLSQLAIEVESDTFVEQRYVVLDGRKRRSVFRPNEAVWERPKARLIDAVIDASKRSPGIEVSGPSRAGSMPSTPPPAW